MKLAVLGALIVIALPAPALAADWVLVTESLDGDKYFIDRQSIRTMSNGKRRAWERAEYALKDKFGDTLSIIYYEFNCIENSRRLLTSNHYNGEEVTASSNALGSNGEWRFLPPGSVGEDLINFVCRK